jgi:hypothetical protein
MQEDGHVSKCSRPALFCFSLTLTIRFCNRHTLRCFGNVLLLPHFCETKCNSDILASGACAVGDMHRVLRVAISVVNHGDENVERERRLGLMEVIKVISSMVLYRIQNSMQNNYL